MRSRFHLWIVAVFMVLSLPTPSVHADGAREDVARIVRLMGYGAGIHNFKNYVLRGRKEYSASARQEFKGVLQVITHLEGSEGLHSIEDQQALVAVKAVIESYHAALDRVAVLHDKGWRVEDIDRAVIIDDTAAKNGLDHLRSKWAWSDLEEIEFQLGYGKAIHNFKNYVLRGHESYHTAALENLLAVDSIIVGQLSQPELATPQMAAESQVAREGGDDHDPGKAYDKNVSEMARQFQEDRAALEGLERVARAYRENLALVERLIAMQRSVRQIDLAVKINDGPAEAALAHLREQFTATAARLPRR